MRGPASSGPNVELEIFSSGVLELASTRMLRNEFLFQGVNFHLHRDRSQTGNEIVSTMLKRRREHGSEASRLGIKGACALSWMSDNRSNSQEPDSFTQPTTY